MNQRIHVTAVTWPFVCSLIKILPPHHHHTTTKPPPHHHHHTTTATTTTHTPHTHHTHHSHHHHHHREQIIPELATAKCPSPVMDCDAFGLAGADRLLIDFTLRFGMVDRYKLGKRACPAASAESDKQLRYLPMGGVSVRGVGMEVLGRHGPELTSLLAELADRARISAIQHGRAPARLLRKWRCQLSSICARLVGRQVTLSQAGAVHAWEQRQQQFAEQAP